MANSKALSAPRDITSSTAQLNSQSDPEGLGGSDRRTKSAKTKREKAIVRQVFAAGDATTAE
jgi:hypothetical protein